MSVNIVRSKYASTRHCLLSAATVCMSPHLPAQQDQNGLWVGQLGPDSVVRDYERAYGAVPTFGADPGKVWELCNTYGGFEAYYPAYPFGWDLELIERTLEWAPLLVSYFNVWDWDGQPLSAHAAVAYGLVDDRIAIWDQAAGKEIAWSLDDFFWAWVWKEGQWQAYQRFTGWFVALLPADWGSPETW